ncbi:MAG: ABC transporter permease [Ruminococcus sp.]|nr:ABC transporter permease [Ruminococcus sp.]
MLFKLSLSNIRKSLRDYAIYFFTLIIGVAIFYIFNAISGQTAMMKMSEAQYEIIQLLGTTISGMSVFIAGVLGFLIVYASRFLMKRRNKEFALYMMLGMGKRKISAILLIETVMIGIGSLVVGLLIGIGLSQLTSVLVANLFEADMTSYRFTVSTEAIMKTIIYFAVMYAVVMVFNSFIVTKMKLIDLIQSGKKSEQIKLKNPVLCVVIFLLSAAALGFAYYKVGYNSTTVTRNGMITYIGIGIVSTFLIFWSVSGMLLRVMMSMKNIYHRGLNSFTFRQVSSKVNTMVFSMTVICLMLFLTICALASSFSVRNSMNQNLDTLCPVDYEVMFNCDNKVDKKYDSIIEMCSANNYEITEDFSKYTDFRTYGDSDFLFADAFGDKIDEVKAQYAFLNYEAPEQIVKLSDYNALMEVYGREKLSLNDDEFIVLCNYTSMKSLRDSTLRKGQEITIFGNKLKSRYDECQDGFIDISTEHINAGLFVVPDNAVDESCAVYEYFIGSYKSDDKKSAEENVKSKIQSVVDSAGEDTNIKLMGRTTKIEISESAVGLGAVVTFLGLYIGLVFLIACGAILALKELSESVDSIGRYEMLRKIGAEESDISKSLFCQTSIFFLLPMILAVFHSIFGMKYSVYFLQVFGTDNISSSITATSAIILLIYGGYFLVTYFCSKGIVKGKK